MSTVFEALSWLVMYVLLGLTAARWHQCQTQTRRRRIERRTADAIDRIQARYQVAAEAAIHQAMRRAWHAPGQWPPQGSGAQQSESTD